MLTDASAVSTLRTKVCVLLSGGIDSAACAAYYRVLGCDVHCIWVDYGQPARVPEERAAERVSSHLAVSLQKVIITGLKWRHVGRDSSELTARNLSLIALAANTFPFTSGLISLGIHDDCHYVDCMKPFQSQADALVSLLTHGLIRCDFPLKELSKVEVVQYAISRGLGPSVTYSCQEGGDAPCGMCASCIDIRESLSILGITS